VRLRLSVSQRQLCEWRTKRKRGGKKGGGRARRSRYVGVGWHKLIELILEIKRVWYKT
jgi:hypothetical protein